MVGNADANANRIHIVRPSTARVLASLARRTFRRAGIRRCLGSLDTDSHVALLDLLLFGIERDGSAGALPGGERVSLTYRGIASPSGASTHRRGLLRGDSDALRRARSVRSGHVQVGSPSRTPRVRDDGAAIDLYWRVQPG